MAHYCPTTGKACHASSSDAHRNAEEMQRRRRQRDRSTVYKCEHCGWWHTCQKVHDKPAHQRSFVPHPETVLTVDMVPKWSTAS